jgi:hypothetical protein
MSSVPPKVSQNTLFLVGQEKIAQGHLCLERQPVIVKVLIRDRGGKPALMRMGMRFTLSLGPH